MSDMRRSDGAANGKARDERRLDVLGMQFISSMSRNQGGVTTDDRLLRAHMKINRHHRQPLPGAKGSLLRGNVVEPHVLEVEAIGLWQTLLSHLPAQLALDVERLAASSTDAEFTANYDRVIEQVLLSAKNVAFEAADGMRAKCPLCTSSPQGAYETADGFLLPMGLEKHLTGHQRSYECAVLAAAGRRASASVAGHAIA